MLTVKEINALAQPLIDTYANVETELLLWIAEKFGKYTYIAGDLEWKLKQLSDMGGLDDKAIRIISQLNNIPFKEVKNLIKDAGIKSIDFKTYRKAFESGATNVNVDNINFDSVINAVYGEISGELRLMHQEISRHTLKAYNQVLNQINLETVTGLYDYNTSLSRALSKLSKDGIRTQAYTRRYKNANGTEKVTVVEYSIEAVARRTITSAITRSANDHNDKVGKELDTKWWITTQHLGARDKGIGHRNHESWQNKPYEESEFVSATGEGLVDGLGGANCKHVKYAYFPGISIDLPDINAEENARIYDLEQRQRYLERQVRYSKRELAMALETDDKDLALQARKKLKQRRAKLKQHINKNSDVLRYDSVRVKIQTDD